MVQAAVFHEMAHRLHAVRVAPAGHAAVHRAAPGLGEGVEILVSRGDLLFAGQLELVGHVGLLPVDVPLGQHAVQLRAPVAAGLRLVVEEAGDRLAEIGLEMIVVRLIDLLQKPIHAILAGAVDAQLSVLPAEGGACTWVNFMIFHLPAGTCQESLPSRTCGAKSTRLSPSILPSAVTRPATAAM